MVMKEFLKELTELTLKYKLVICGDGTYSHIKVESCSNTLSGGYIETFCDGDGFYNTAFEWKDS